MTPRAGIPGYGFAVAMVAAAALLSLLTRSWMEGAPFLFFLLASVAAARFGGFGPGALATVFGALAVQWVFAPRPTPGLSGPPGAFALVGFLAVSGIACWMVAAAGTARKRPGHVLDSIAEGFVVIDPSWRLVQVNGRAAEMAGKPRQELTGKRIHEVFPGFEGMPFFGELRSAMVERRPTRVEAYVPSRDAWFELQGLPAKNGLALLVRDVSERVRGHRQLEATLADLARSNYELERFAASVSHDWVQPLSSIMTFAELAKDQSTGDAQRNARNIIEAVKRMDLLLQTRREGSKAGPETADLEPTALEDVLEGVLNDLRGVLVGRGITIASEGLPTVNAEPMLVRQLLLSLISGQVRSAEPGPGRLVFSAERDDRDSWVVSLRGCHQSALPAADVAPEKGDHFAISKRIIEFHGGRLWIDSSADGTPMIRFSLPADRRATVASV